MIQRLLRENLTFRHFWTAQTISLVGDQISLIALPLAAVLVLHAHAAEMGYLTAAALAPNLLFSLHFGAWIDRRGRRREAMIAADVGRAAVTLTVPVAYAFGALTMEHLYAAAFLTGTLSVLFAVSYNTLFVSIVPREEYIEANQLLNGSRAVSYAGGPSIGGVLVQALSAPVALVADALSFLGSAFFLRRISPPEPPAEERARGHLADGSRFVWTEPTIRASLLATATINFFNFVFFALFVLFATRELHVRPGILGLVLGAGAAGGVIGAAVVGRVVRRIGVGAAFVLGCALFPAPLLLVPLASGPYAVVLLMLFAAEFGSGLGVMILDIAGGSIKQALVPDRLRARVSGAYMVVNYGVRPLGGLAGGWLGSAIGLRETLWIATAGALLGVLFLLPSPLPRMRELPQPASYPA
ncbi:MAG TPA: MFS transporter [Gaiellaceae bacterium]|nr:MFS transporter [Gaiellaceae bacterium]